MMLYRGDAIALNPGRTGLTDPIETARYRKLAVKMKVIGAPANQQMVAYWFHDSYAAPNYLNRAGGILLPTVIPAGTSEQIYVFDLTQAGSGGSQLVAACGGGGACTGTPAAYAAEAWCAGSGSTRPRRSHRRESRSTGCGSPRRTARRRPR